MTEVKETLKRPKTSVCQGSLAASLLLTSKTGIKESREATAIQRKNNQTEPIDCKIKQRAIISRLIPSIIIVARR
jgi:hypothetical protein